MPDMIITSFLVWVVGVVIVWLGNTKDVKTEREKIIIGILWPLSLTLYLVFFVVDVFKTAFKIITHKEDQ